MIDGFRFLVVYPSPKIYRLSSCHKVADSKKWCIICIFTHTHTHTELILIKILVSSTWCVNLFFLSCSSVLWPACYQGTADRKSHRSHSSYVALVVHSMCTTVRLQSFAFVANTPDFSYLPMCRWFSGLLPVVNMDSLYIRSNYIYTDSYTLCKYW